VVKNLVSPFQGWADFHSDQIPRALPWAFLFRPLRGRQKSATPKKTRMANSTGIGRFSERCWLFHCANREQT
jgi:hypothetical protein